MRHRKLGRLRSVRLVADQLAYLEGRQPTPPDLNEVPRSKRQHAAELLCLINLCWGRKPAIDQHLDRQAQQPAHTTRRRTSVPPRVATAMLVGALIVGALVVALYAIGSTTP